VAEGGDDLLPRPRGAGHITSDNSYVAGSSRVVQNACKPALIYLQLPSAMCSPALEGIRMVSEGHLGLGSSGVRSWWIKRRRLSCDPQTQIV
jgi:hypothetical protein